MIAPLPSTGAISAKIGSFVPMIAPRTIWVISSLQGKLEGLDLLHEIVLSRFQAGDRLIYTGNMIGATHENLEVLDALVSFRRLLLALPSVVPSDFIYLRGAQEEMFQKLFQLTYAPNPADILQWIYAHGGREIIEDYGLDPEEALRAARNGPMKIQQWIGKLRAAHYQHHGHMKLLMELKRAAYAADLSGQALGTLVVSAGLKRRVSPDRQGDSFWWGGKHFNDVDLPYEEFSRIVRGYDPLHQGLKIGTSILSLDKGEDSIPYLAELHPSGEIAALFQGK